MKQTQQEQPEGEEARAKKKMRLSVAPVDRTALIAEAMRAACVREGEPLSSQPLIVNVLDHNSETFVKVACWPRDEKMGHHIYACLVDDKGADTEDEDDPDAGTDLVGVFTAFDNFEKRLPALLGATSMAELGVLKYVVDKPSRDMMAVSVKATKLHPVEFRLDLEYS